MFGAYLQRRREKKLADEALGMALRGRLGDALALVDARSNAGSFGAHLRLAERLHAANALNDALLIVDAVLARDAGALEALTFKVELCDALGRDEEIVPLLRRVVALAPNHLAPARALADRLTAGGMFADVVSALWPFRQLPEPEVLLTLGRALLAVERDEDAEGALGAAAHLLESRLRQELNPGAFNALRDLHFAASELLTEASARVRGPEGAAARMAAAGKLDARAGINYRLLGQSLMVEATPRPESTQLLSIADYAARGAARVKRDARDATGHTDLGIAALRSGAASKARKHFQEATRRDGRSFAAFLGIGAAMEHAEHDVYRRCEALIDPGPVAGIDRVVPAWPALSELERKVVRVCVYPLRSHLAALTESGAQLHILPLDVRATDLDLFADVMQQRTEDHRAYEAITGIASEQGAVAKIEDLLDIESASGWVLAHEFTHLVHMHFAEPLAERVRQLYGRARRIRYASGFYDLENEYELLAVAYQDYLRTKHGCSLDKEPDDRGLQVSLFAFFDELAALD